MVIDVKKVYLNIFITLSRLYIYAKFPFFSQLNQVNKAVPLIVAGGGGGLGIGRYLDDDVQQARGIVPDVQEISGQVLFDNFETMPAGPGGGWRGKSDSALDPHYGAALLEGSRGGVACYKTLGVHGFGGFGGGGGGCDTGGENEV